MQRIIYEKAVTELLDEVKLRFNPIPGIDFGRPKPPVRNLFLLNGTKVESLLDIPEDTIIMIASPGDEL